MLSVSIENGKYTVVQEDDGTVCVQRFGEDWRGVTGDKLILTLAYEIDKLREQLKGVSSKEERARLPYGQHSADECDDPTCSHY